jgi:hypothetical protein
MVCASPALAAAINHDADFASAMAEYDRQHFDVAFERLARLADGGHAEAARVALLMHAHGRRLYGRAYPIRTERRGVWLALALPPAQVATVAARH